jgi:hypothetical protein
VSVGTKSTSEKSRIHQDLNYAELCAGPALATSRFSPSPQKERTEGMGTQSGWDSLGIGHRQFWEPDDGKKPRERIGIHGLRAGEVSQSDSIRDVADY